MKSPILFELSDIKELYDAFKEFVRTLAYYDECIRRIQNYDTSFFKLVIKNNQTKKSFKVRKNDFLGRSSAPFDKQMIKPTPQHAQFYGAWVNNNKPVSLIGTQIRYKKRHINLLGHMDLPFKDVRIFLAPEALILSKTDDKTPFKNVPVQNPHAIEELVYLAETYDEFMAKFNGKKTQENFNVYFKNNYLMRVITPYFRQSMAEPIIKIMEQTRRLLAETLLKNYRSDIAQKQAQVQDTNAPEAFLKNNKDEIFNISQSVGLIPNAKKMIDIHELRNDLAHPDVDMDIWVDVPETVHDIYTTIFDFMRHITNTKNLSVAKMHEPGTGKQQLSLFDFVPNGWVKDVIPVVAKDRDDETPNLIHAMQSLDLAVQSMIPRDANGKELKGKKQFQWLINEGIMDESDKQDYEAAKLLRNEVCHGNATTNTHAQIIATNATSQQLTQKIIQNLQQKKQQNGV